MQAHTRSVLLVHPDAHRRLALAEAFRASRVVSAASRDGALRQVAETSLELVLAHQSEARGLMRELDRAALHPPRMLLGSLSDPRSVEALAEMAAEGHQFYTLDDDLPPAQLERQVHAILDGRRSSRARLESTNLASFNASGRTFELVCLDIGNRGLSVLVDPRSPVEALLPGTPVSHMVVRSPDREVLRAVSGRVRHVLRMRDGKQESFRVGIELVSEAMARAGERVVDPIRVLASLRRALRRGEPLHLQLLDFPERQCITQQAELRIAVGTAPAVLAVPDAQALSPGKGDVVKVAFELGGHSYSGVSTVNGRDSETGALLLTVPRTLTSQHRRSYLRLPSGTADGYAISFRSTSTGQTQRYPLLELHPYGFSFRYDAAREVLPPGLVFDELTLHLPDGSTEACQGEVRDVQPLTGDVEGEAPHRCGAMLKALDGLARDAVIDSQLSLRFPSMSNGARSPFADVWRVIRDANQMYPEYPLEDGPHLATLEDTHQKLARAGLSLSRTILHRDEGGVPKGHVAGLRVYSKTWFIHHLAVAPGYHRGDQLSRQLSSLALDHAEHLEDIDFVRLLWRTENRWSDRVLGSVARALGAGGLSVVRRYEYARLPLTGALPAFPPPTRMARRMRKSDDQWLESYLRGRGELMRMRADELSVDEMELASVGRRYAAHGLARGRAGFVVDGSDGPLAFALAEHATAGLDWPEVTNGFTLFVPDPSHLHADAARHALIQRCVEHYRELGRPWAICVADAQDLPALHEAGFDTTSAGEIAEWTFHRQAARACHELLQLVFERVARPSRARKAVEDKDT